ncbi:hypothetical protein ACIQGZ_17555 [Streptomyces sp. NPDC092296]|uniref:hypothetical protein n=1 Tax=Streptomyces sp. NPDC092296 TaxID=3366012 RepID=UPI00382B84C0
MTTRDQAIANAARALIRAVTAQAAMDPRTAAEGAWYPGHPLTVEEIEARITARRQRAARLRTTSAASQKAAA